MHDQSIELINPILGMEPYVLLEFRQGDEGEDDLRVSVRAGGGITADEDIGMALLMALTNLPGGGGPLGAVVGQLAAEFPEAMARLREELGLDDEGHA